MSFSGYLKQSTAVTLKIGPFLDDTDGKTAETGLTISQADVRLAKNGADMAQKNDSTSCTHDEIGVYDCPLDATDTNTLGLLTLDVAEGGALPIRHSYMVLPASEYDQRFAITGAVPNLGILARGTAQSATSTTLVLASGESFGDDTLIGATLAVFGSTQSYWQTRTVTDYVSSTDTATVDAWTVTPSGTITYVVFAGAPASATSLPAVNVAQISGDSTAADNLEAALDGTGGVTISAVLGANAITATSLATDAITAAKVAADAVTEIQSGLATAAALTTVDTVVDAIKAKTDSLTFTVAGQVDANAESMNATAIIGNGTAGNKWRGA